MIDIDWSGLEECNIILDTIAFWIVVALVIRFIRSGRKFTKKEGKTEDRMFFGICLLNMLLAVVDALLFMDDNFFEDLDEGISAFFFVSDSCVAILSLMIIVQWLLLIEYTLHQSRDLIRRRYPLVLIPFAIAVLLELISIFPMFEATIIDDIDLWDIGDRIHQVSMMVTLFYIILTYLVVHHERKVRQLPRYIMATPMGIIVIVGFLLDSLTDFSILALALAIALVCLEISVTKRTAWEDERTGYYNENYARVIMDYVSENRIQGGTIIRFVTGDDSEALSSILHSMEPDNSKTIYMGNGVFLIVTETQPETVVEWYKNLILDQAGKQGIKVKADHFTRNDESPEKFLESCMRAQR